MTAQWGPTSVPDRFEAGRAVRPSTLRTTVSVDSGESMGWVRSGALDAAALDGPTNQEIL
jgi:hypothetical protein